ncbi:MarR family transcriptional regulator [Iodidimonas sp. SYSU 1G8]|uniref:MarR family winged helix-turn-helix transcriptional regulator n=1 Tax=Iodidimonas sp. SYSU 1G8 TaxID=3133967 RepID=UPI0031FE8964
MKKDELDRTFGFLVHDIGRLMRREFERRVRDMGFTRAQWRVLAHLRRIDGINQSQLADRMDVEPITLVRLLDKLEAAGYVQRRQDPQDRRAYLLYLTEKAGPLIERLEVISEELRQEMLGDLTPDERDTLIDMLMRIKSNMTNKTTETLWEVAAHE